MIDTIILLIMIVLAVLTFHTRLLRTAIIYLSVISLLAAAIYLRSAAPELAIAEAAIGSGLVALLYLAALKRNRVYTLAVVAEGRHERLIDPYIRHIERSRALKKIRHFFVIREFEVQVVFVPESLEEALQNSAYDLVLREDEQGIAAFVDDDNYIMLELEMMLQMQGAESDLRFIRI